MQMFIIFAFESYIIFTFFISVQLIANGQNSPVVMRPVVKESKQEGLKYWQIMVAKIVPALIQRVAKSNLVQVSH